MARLYTDKNFPLPVVELLRAFGHDVLTTQEAGNANLGIPDEDVLAFAVSSERAVLTRNRGDFILALVLLLLHLCNAIGKIKQGQADTG